MSMNHGGMRFSLVSREIIADSIECVMHAERVQERAVRRAIESLNRDARGKLLRIHG